MDIKYFFKMLKKVNIKDVKKDTKKLSKKIDKSYISILFDMALCNMKYGCSYKEYILYEFYSLNEEEKKTYITEKINNEIIDKYNSKEDMYILNDKGAFNKYFKDYIGRDFLDLREASFKDFSDFINNKNIIVCKTVNNYLDNKVEYIEIEKDKLKNEYNILKIYNSIIKKEEYIIEEYLKYNGKFNNNGLNSLKVTTFINDKGDVKILNSVLRINNGNNDVLESLVNKEGVVYTYAVDKKGHTFIEHPKLFERIKDYQIPDYEEIIEKVKTIAKQVKTIRYASYSLSRTNKGIVVLNANANPTCFQMSPSKCNKKEGMLLKYKEHIKL